MTIECYGICSEKCTAMQNGKCVLDAKKAEGANDFQLYKEDEEKNDSTQTNTQNCVGCALNREISANWK